MARLFDARAPLPGSARGRDAAGRGRAASAPRGWCPPRGRESGGTPIVRRCGTTAWLVAGLVCIFGAPDGATARAQEPKPAADAAAPSPPAAAVRATVAKSTVKTSERVALTVTIDAPAGWKADPLSLQDALPEGWNVLRTGAPTAAPLPGGERVTQSFELEPFLPGKAEIKPLSIVLRPAAPAAGEPGAKHDAAPAPLSSAGGPIELRTAPVTVEVLSVLPEGEAAPELADIKSVVEPRTPTNWWLVGGVALGLLGLGWLAWALVARARRAAARRVVTRPAHEIALERLDRLLSRGLLEPGRERFKEFFDGASAVLREYIEDRFALRAPERTTDEFLRDARASAKLSENDVDALGRFLAECDMVKFANARPRGEDARRAAEIVREFIIKTRAPEATVIIAGPGAVSGPRLAAAATDEPSSSAGRGVAAEGAAR